MAVKESHEYTSTACVHGQHDRCRLVCKFCYSPCECDCHQDAKKCKYGDPTCPCQDGDQCHYEGENPMTPYNQVLED